MEPSQVRLLEFGFLKLTLFDQSKCEIVAHVFKKSTFGLIYFACYSYFVVHVIILEGPH